ncbi:hypothetical protein Btru_072194 [Bulinus truncatus]|nr:hypothetical protein Btru_072194 [Bulinus truncatus]
MSRVIVTPRLLRELEDRMLVESVVFRRMDRTEKRSLEESEDGQNWYSQKMVTIRRWPEIVESDDGHSHKMATSSIVRRRPEVE